MCREEATELEAKTPELEALGVRVVCVLKENIPEEVEAFRRCCWHGELFLDEQMNFYKALYGGQYRQVSFLSFFGQVFNCGSKFWANNKRAKAKGDFQGNLKGEGRITGGMFVVQQGGSIVYSFQEEIIGDHAPLPDVMKACMQATA